MLGLAKGHQYACDLMTRGTTVRQRKVTGPRQRKIFVRQCSMLFFAEKKDKHALENIYSSSMNALFLTLASSSNR
jgi:hypothetical protein